MKKSLKFVIMMALGIMLVLGLAACQQQSGGEEKADEAAAETAAVEDAAAAGQVYIIATDTTFAPFEYANADGTYEGIDVDLLAAVAADQGFAYELQPLGFDAALQAVQAGQADGVIAGMSITDERKQVFDFSAPYYDSTVCCAASPESGVASLEDLNGKTVAVKIGTQSEKWANSIAEQYGFTTTTFETSDIMYQDVIAGNSVACFEDTPVMSYAISTGNVNLNIIADCGADSEFATPYGFAVATGKNAELLGMFDAGLANIKASGDYDKIVAKYVQTAPAQ